MYQLKQQKPHVGGICHGFAVWSRCLNERETLCKYRHNVKITDLIKQGKISDAEKLISRIESQLNFNSSTKGKGWIRAGILRLRGMIYVSKNEFEFAAKLYNQSISTLRGLIQQRKSKAGELVSLMIELAKLNAYAFKRYDLVEQLVDEAINYPLDEMERRNILFDFCQYLFDKKIDDFIANVKYLELVISIDKKYNQFDTIAYGSLIYYLFKLKNFEKAQEVYFEYHKMRKEYFHGRNLTNQDGELPKRLAQWHVLQTSS